MRVATLCLDALMRSADSAHGKGAEARRSLLPPERANMPRLARALLAAALCAALGRGAVLSVPADLRTPPAPARSLSAPVDWAVVYRVSSGGYMKTKPAFVTKTACWANFLQVLCAEPDAPSVLLLLVQDAVEAPLAAAKETPKLSTGITGLAVDPNWRTTLTRLYERTLVDVQVRGCAVPPLRGRAGARAARGVRAARRRRWTRAFARPAVDPGARGVPQVGGVVHGAPT
jgi:hypothetical protein